MALTSLEKGVELLRIVAAHGRGCRMATLTDESGMPRSSVLRLIVQLEGAGLIERDATRQKFFIGPMLRSFAAAGRARRGIVDLAENTLAWLAEKTSETNYLSLRLGLDAVCVSRVDGSTPVRAVTLQVGTRRPLGVGASATAILAALDDADVAEILEMNAERMPPASDAAAIRAMVNEVRQTGIATHESESVAGVICYGTPVRDADGRARAALSLSFVGEHVSEADRSDYKRLLIDAARRVERRLAGDEPVRANTSDARILADAIRNSQALQ